MDGCCGGGSAGGGAPPAADPSADVETATDGEPTGAPSAREPSATAEAPIGARLTSGADELACETCACVHCIAQQRQISDQSDAEAGRR